MDGGKALPPRTLEVLARLHGGYAPTVPEELVLHCMRRAGDDTGDPMILRFIGLAGECFLGNILADAMQCARRKQQIPLPARRQLGLAPVGKKDEKRSQLLTEDLLEALKEAGLDVHRPAYYVNVAR